MTLSRRWVRSWPTVPPVPLEGRSYVVDDLPRLKISNYDLAENSASWTVLRDCTLLEWDIVVSPDDMLTWEAHVNEHPYHVLVAPYRVYAGDGYGADDWMSRGDGERTERFGFGMIWFPAAVLDRFHQADHNLHAMWFTDGTFSAWYSTAYGPARVVSAIRPIHLNYRISLPAAADQG